MHIKTHYTSDQMKSILQKAAVKWSLASFTKRGVIIYQLYGKCFMILSYNADKSRQYFRARLKENADGKIEIYGHFGVPLLPFFIIFFSMVGIEMEKGGAIKGSLVAVLLIGLYVMIELGISAINTKSKRAITSFLRSELTGRTAD